MDIGADQMVATIAEGTTGYLVTFLPIGAFVIGLTLAFVVMFFLVSLLAGRRSLDENEKMLDND